ncbi:uncharacterized protein PV06_08550 [Exophiala oligosperma]|uniref:Uncharacterized protein n=2 Tax=Chaetothyriales TaxID=34395 RepID=A0A0D2DA77_9EURO|nr:uncharacterized protein PV06_08550 [Exophiala oligosperma]KAJ9634000.1 hypothetical protein H2204_006547 [Knufia peltigerae]KIW39993.1 hypothetical protein PV06_08550 [Exophiala oligosperma]
MSLTTTFTLPFRKATTPSLTLDPCFKVLYENNKQNLTFFVTTKAPLPLSEVTKSKPFIGYLSTKEPGPVVEYDNMRTAIAAMRGYLMCTPHGVKMMDFYKDLLRLQGHWLIALAEQCAFDTWIKLTQALLIDRNDDALLESVTQTIPTAASNLCVSGFIDRYQFAQLVQHEQSRLRLQCHEAAEELYAFKTSKDFWNQHTKLVAMVEHCENKLREIRQRSARRKTQRIAKSRAAAEYNSDIFTRQMGMSARYFPQPPHVTRRVDNWMTETRNRCFGHLDARLEDSGITFDSAEIYNNNDHAQAVAAGVVPPLQPHQTQTQIQPQQV